ncbi:hypothetical protein Q5P01_006982 [Channa striata]|uniref:Uncharacterized protein n=1 Tax=Channa striata TaxID=64152 RepID=A0AA88NDU5_CHASR|nr:hypothetical protein Q5P01_006982 [Channa striata]
MGFREPLVSLYEVCEASGEMSSSDWSCTDAASPMSRQPERPSVHGLSGSDEKITAPKLLLRVRRSTITDSVQQSADEENTETSTRCSVQRKETSRREVLKPEGGRSATFSSELPYGASGSEAHLDAAVTLPWRSGGQQRTGDTCSVDIELMGEPSATRRRDGKTSSSSSLEVEDEMKSYP